MRARKRNGLVGDTHRPPPPRERRGRAEILTRAVLLQIALISAVLCLPALPGNAQANGATRLLGVEENAGPYRLRVGILPGTPRVGTLHVTVLVDEAEGGAPLTDASIEVSARGPEGSAGAGPVRAANSIQDIRFYEANLPLDVEGAWVLNVAVDGPLGQGKGSWPIQVRPGQSLDLVYLLAAAVGLAALGVWVWDRIRAARRRRNSAQ